MANEKGKGEVRDVPRRLEFPFAEASWHLLRCNRCHFADRMSLAVGSIACPKKCKGTMTPVYEVRIAGKKLSEIYPNGLTVGLRGGEIVDISEPSDGGEALLRTLEELP